MSAMAGRCSGIPRIRHDRAMSTTASTSAGTEQAGHGAAGARVASILREAILAGEYEPGARIRQEDLADRHGASRVPVREALRMLEAEGLVTLVANTGAWVSQLSQAECDELYQVRERIEPLLLRYNAPLLTEAGLDRLDSLAVAMERAGDVEDFLVLDRAVPPVVLRARADHDARRHGQEPLEPHAALPPCVLTLLPLGGRPQRASRAPPAGVGTPAR